MTIRVLIVDDHTIVREGLRRILGASPGIEVTGEAAEGVEALRIIAKRMPDVMLMDISMPGMGGLELLDRVRADYPGLPVLVLSMHKEEQFALRFLKAGAAGYLTKDCAHEQLAQAILRVAAGGQHITREVADALTHAVIPAHLESPHKILSHREFQVFQMLAAGRAVNDIAQELSLSANTVSTHKRRLMDKLGVANTADLVRYAVTHQLDQ
jgi:two-component system invasion response regulator UvrY